MTGLNTNILVRFITQDDPLQSPKGDAIMNSLTPDEPGWIAIASTAEFAWVMKRIYRVNREDDYSMLTMFLTWPDIVMENANLVRSAANLFRQGTAEFTDYLVESSAREAGCSRTLTFDRKAAKSAGMTLVQ